MLYGYIYLYFISWSRRQLLRIWSLGPNIKYGTDERRANRHKVHGADYIIIIINRVFTHLHIDLAKPSLTGC